MYSLEEVIGQSHEHLPPWWCLHCDIIDTVANCIIYFSLCCDKIPGKITLRNGGFTLADSLRHSPAVRQMVTASAVRDKCWCSDLFPLYTSFILMCVCMCIVWVYVCVWECAHAFRWQIRSELKLWGNCELFSIGSGNWTPVPCKSKACSLLRHLSNVLSPFYSFWDPSPVGWYCQQLLLTVSNQL